MPRTTKTTGKSKSQKTNISETNDDSVDNSSNILRLPAELKYKDELDYLKSIDVDEKPVNWKLSPKLVSTFILGSKEKDKFKIDITQKFYGDPRLVERAIVTLASDRGLLLIGDPGTGKSWLAELLSAAISNCSTMVVQGTAATTEDQIKYSWNIASVIAKGQSLENLIPSPIMVAMQGGLIGRFEELTRCTSDVQDALISMLSEKYISIPELPSEGVSYAKEGFNVIATANSRDKGVNDLSSALKRRFNFVTIPIVTNKSLEKEIVSFRINDLMIKKGLKVKIPPTLFDTLLETFQDLRTANDSSKNDGDKLESALSTAEQIGVLENALLQAHFFDGVSESKALAQSLISSLVRRVPEDLSMMNKFWHSAIQDKQSKSDFYKDFFIEGKEVMKSF